MLKIFAVQIGDKVGSFAPIELKEQTRKEMQALLKFDATKLDKEKEKEILQIQKELKTAVFIEGEVINITEEPIFNKKTKE
ncbi:hypothetical protein [Pseudomonas plecoglossicida]|uniref:hypothetical protein n=1 Tax=Bacteria TaxID=2 RepID=UPI0034E1FC9A